jgi:hypothetical protein
LSALLKEWLRVAWQLSWFKSKHLFVPGGNFLPEKANERRYVHASQFPRGGAQKLQADGSSRAWKGCAGRGECSNDIADTTEYNGKRVIEKMAAAAAALGWPEQIVDAARVQMQSIAEMQIQTMDQMMDAWEEQLRLPNPTSVSPSAMVSKLKSLPGFAPTGNWPGAAAFQNAAMNPLQFWMQFAQQWQKSWTDTMTFWGKAGKLH